MKELDDLIKEEPDNMVYQMSVMNLQFGYERLGKLVSRFQQGNIGLPCTVISN